MGMAENETEQSRPPDDEPAPSFGLRVLRDSVLDVYGEAEVIGEEQRRFAFLTTGLHDLNGMTGGLRPGELTLIAGRPGHGKTRLACTVALHVAIVESGTVAMFLPGQSRAKSIMRLMFAVAHVDEHRLGTGQMSEDEWTALAASVEDAYNAPLFIDPDPSPSAMDVEERCLGLKKEHGLGLIVIDGLDLLEAAVPRSTRNEEITDIVRDIKRAARALDVPVVLTCGLSRSVEQRDNKRGNAHDLPGWGGVEEIADNVWCLYRERPCRSYASHGGVEDVELAVVKNACGPVGIIKIALRPGSHGFTDLDG